VFLEVWQGKELRVEFADLWQRKDLVVSGEWREKNLRIEGKCRRGGAVPRLLLGSTEMDVLKSRGMLTDI
jgi:hypothetical protein